MDFQVDATKTDEKVDAEQASMIWQKLCAINQRLLLAKAVNNKLWNSHLGNPEESKHKLLKSLQDETAILNFIKLQLEESLVRYFANEVALNDIEAIQDISIPLTTSTAAFPVTHLETLVRPDSINTPSLGNDK